MNSLLEIIKKNTKFDFFTTPSHAQKFFIFNKIRNFYKYDISETDAYKPQDALVESEKRATAIYGTKSTKFLINGSTSGIIASVLACVNREDKVLIWNNAHPSHKNAVLLAGGVPIFYELEKDDKWGIYKEFRADILENILRTTKVKALVVTSPSYYGVVSDIEKIKSVCVKYGTYLIVDEAWGALLPFCERLPKSAIYQGGDFVIQSLHKSAGGLNPTALLHSNCDIDIGLAISKISTTSPSYPLLASIEKNINYLNSAKGNKKILELAEAVDELKQNVKTVEFYSGNDFTKILIKSDKISGGELSEFLYKHNIEDEKTNEKSTMLLCGLGTELKKIKRLEVLLNKLR